MKLLTVDEIKEKVTPALKEAGVTKSALFGSYVRGETKEMSDVDILVEYPTGMSLFDVAALQNTLEDLLGTSVDLVDYAYIKPRLRQSILLERVPIYE